MELGLADGGALLRDEIQEEDSALSAKTLLFCNFKEVSQVNYLMMKFAKARFLQYKLNKLTKFNIRLSQISSKTIYPSATLHQRPSF